MKLFFVCLFFSLSTYASYIDYYKHINEAEYQMYQGNYDFAIANFKMGFNEVEKPFARDLYYTARCYAQLRNDTELYLSLEQALKNGLSKHQITKDSLWFTDYRFTDKFIDLLKVDYPKSQITDPIYDKQVEAIWTELMFYSYNKVDSVKQIFGEDSEEFISYKKLNLQAHQKNSKAFFQLIINNDIPNLMRMRDNTILHNSDKRISSNIRYVMFMLFFNYLNEDVKEIDLVLNKLQKGLVDGKIPPIFYARIIDLYLISVKKSNKYGLEFDSIHQKDLQQIIINRREIGVSSYYASSPSYQKYFLDFDISYNVKPE